MAVASVSERCKKGRVKLCGNGSAEANFLKCFSFCSKINISQSVTGGFKRSAIVPAIKSDRLTKDLVNNVNLLFTRLLFPRLITLPIR